MRTIYPAGDNYRRITHTKTTASIVIFYDILIVNVDNYN